MSEQSPYEQLGVTEESSFEEIQEAKQRLLQQYENDVKITEAIEAAYDAVIMDRLRLRQEGKIKVPDRIRFPERSPAPKPESKPLISNQSPGWLRGLIDTPSARDIGIPAAVFGSLGAASLVIPDRAGSLSPLLLSLGVFAAIYFLNRKEKRFGRSVLLTFLSLVLGVALGAGVGSVVKSAGVAIPVSGQQLYALITFLLFWVSSSFLR
ncbi:MAG: hypothetical protein N5P05_000231 [Chroococcopsis gigantea SAG 12.99]|jgi:hypothetical protein|nr:CPP1-like family protein [Chlorogloea purpurea SAG 13.99]MDV2998625.1 hypothetical protein [Chroococcopsis gigantea SAG 12.99]